MNIYKRHRFPPDVISYAVRFAARCASQRVEDITLDVAEEAMEPDAPGTSSRGRSRQVSKRLQELDHLQDDADIDMN